MKSIAKLFVLIIIIIAVAVGYAALGNGSGDKTVKIEKAGLIIKDQKDIYDRLEATEPVGYIDDYGIYRIYGSVKNLSQNTCIYAKYKIEIRTEDNKLKKTLDVTVNDIKSGETKSYDINGGTGMEGVKVIGHIIEAGFPKR